MICVVVLEKGQCEKSFNCMLYAKLQFLYKSVFIFYDLCTFKIEVFQPTNNIQDQDFFPVY